MELTIQIYQKVQTIHYLNGLENFVSVIPGIVKHIYGGGREGALEQNKHSRHFWSRTSTALEQN